MHAAVDKCKVLNFSVLWVYLIFRIGHLFYWPEGKCAGRKNVWYVILRNKYRLLQVSVGVHFSLTCLLFSVKNHTDDNISTQIVLFSNPTNQK